MVQQIWAKQTIIKKYPQIINAGGVDFNKDGQIAGTEKLVDFNNNGITGDDQDFLAFLDQNYQLIAAQMKFLPANRYFDLDHPIYEFLSSLSSSVSSADLQKFNSIMSRWVTGVTTKLESSDKSLSLFEKVNLAYAELIKGLTPVDQSGHIVQNLVDGIFDCDTVALLLLGLAFHLAKKDPEWGRLGLVVINGSRHPNFSGGLPIGHVVLKIDNDYFDLGRKRDFLYFSKGFGYPEEKEAFEKLARVYGLKDIRFFLKVQLAKKLITDSDFANADRIFNTVLQPDFPVSFVYNLAGNVKSAMDQKDKASELYKKAVAVNPYDLISFYNLGLLQSDLGHIDEAAASFKTAISLNDKVQKTWYNWAVIYIHQQDYEKASEILEKAVIALPRNADLRIYLADMYAHQDRIEAAITSYQKALSLGTQDLLAYQALVDLILAETQRKSRGMTEIEQTDLLIVQLPKIIDTLKKGLQKLPRNPKIKNSLITTYFQLAGVYYHKENDKEAIKLWAEILSLNPDQKTQANVHFNLATAYINIENYKQAMEHVTQALRIKPADPKLKALEQRIKKLQKSVVPVAPPKKSWWDRFWGN